MKKFLDVNPGLKSRIGYFLDFEDYNIEELLKNELKINNSFGFIKENGDVK